MARFHLITRAFQIFPVLIYCSPQWSVSTVNVLSYRYLFSFCIPHTMAKHSRSSTEYFFSLSFNFLLIYDTTSYNSLLAGALACLLDGLQSVLNAAARLICNRRKY